MSPLQGYCWCCAWVHCRKDALSATVTTGNLWKLQVWLWPAASSRTLLRFFSFGLIIRILCPFPSSSAFDQRSLVCWSAQSDMSSWTAGCFHGVNRTCSRAVEAHHGSKGPRASAGPFEEREISRSNIPWSPCIRVGQTQSQGITVSFCCVQIRLVRYTRKAFFFIRWPASVLYSLHSLLFLCWTATSMSLQAETSTSH